MGVDEPGRAMRFYGEVFGWKFEKSMEAWVIDVPSVDECAKKITSNGGKIIEPKHAIPGVGYVLVFEDTEGNMFGVMQTDSSA